MAECNGQRTTGWSHYWRPLEWLGDPTLGVSTGLLAWPCPDGIVLLYILLWYECRTASHWANFVRVRPKPTFLFLLHPLFLRPLTQKRIPWGIFATIGPAYSSELCPLPLRPYLTAYTNMCFATGQLIGAGVLQSFLNRNDDWAWRIPFALQWMWIPFLFVASFLMPESPWYLVRKGKYAEAERVVCSLMSNDEREHARPLVASMIHTNNLEQRIAEGVQYWDCFRGIDLRRTEIACVSFIGQITCGAQFAYSATYFFQQAGLSSNDSYKLNIGGTSIAFCGTIASWFLMRRFGRRSLYLTGMALMATFLFIIGGLAIDTKSPSIKWVQSILCIVWLLIYSLTVGPLGWSIPAEVSSTRLRSKTVVLARTCYYLAQIVANVIQLYMMNPTAWNWRGLFSIL